MNRLAKFIKKIYLFLIFIILEVLAFNTYQDSSVYTRGELHNSSNKFLIHLHSGVSNVTEYFKLKTINSDLAQQNATLTARLMAMEDMNVRLIRGEVMDTLSGVEGEAMLDTVTFSIDSTIIINDANIKKDKYLSARVVNNSLTRYRNFMTLDRGELDSVKINCPVVSNDMVVGYVVAVSRNYCIAISILNIDFRTSGMLKKDGGICSIFWDGDSPDEVSFSGISRYSDIAVGDTITTTGFSTFFTDGKLIGTVSSFEIKDQMYYGGRLKLFASLNRLRYVDIILPENIDERLQLEDSLKVNI